MKRIVSLSLAVLLVIALAIPAFATDELTGVPPIPTADGEYYIFYTVGNWAYVYVSTHPFTYYTVEKSYHNDGVVVDYECFLQSSSPKWSDRTVSEGHEFSFGDGYYANHDIYTENGDLHYAIVETECDGTSCPANDVNHDNICDDCGKVLTMSLRSTLLDYARNIGETNDKGYNYYAIFKVSDQYRTYVSSTPMTSSDGVILTGTDFTYALAYELDNGSFSHGSWYNGFMTDMTFIEANHHIENFTTPPLAVTIQGVTGEALELTLPNLMNQVMTIVLCGVGCLAFLMVLHLLRSRLFPYLKG